MRQHAMHIRMLVRMLLDHTCCMRARMLYQFKTDRCQYHWKIYFCKLWDEFRPLDTLVCY